MHQEFVCHVTKPRWASACYRGTRREILMYFLSFSCLNCVQLLLILLKNLCIWWILKFKIFLRVTGSMFLQACPPLTSQNDWHSSPSSRRGIGGHILPCSVTQQTNGAAVLSILALDQLFAPFAKFTHGSWAWDMDFSTSFAGGKFSHCDMITWQRDKNSWWRMDSIVDYFLMVLAKTKQKFNRKKSK